MYKYNIIKNDKTFLINKAQYNTVYNHMYIFISNPNFD